jgi:hypothetical protein
VTLPALFSGRVTRVSRLPFHWRGDLASLTALSGQSATLARAVTAAPVDYNAVARTVPRDRPAWQHEDWDGDATRDTLALLLGTSDTCYWSVPVLPAAVTVYLEFVQPGAVPAASSCIWYLGNAGNTGARLWIDSTGTYWRVRHHNGSTEVTSTLSAAPASGNRVALRATLSATGVVQIHQSVNGAAESSATASGTNTLAAAWGDTRLYANSTGSTNAAAISLIRSRLAYGSLTAAQMAVAW